MAKLTIVQADVTSDELAELARVALDRVAPQPIPAPALALAPPAEPAHEPAGRSGHRCACCPPAEPAHEPPPAPTPAAKPKAKAKGKTPAGERRCSECGKSLAGRDPRALVCSDDCRKAKSARVSMEDYARSHQGKDSPRAVPCSECGVLYGAEELDDDNMCKRCLRLAADN